MLIKLGISRKVRAKFVPKGIKGASVMPGVGLKRNINFDNNKHSVSIWNCISQDIKIKNGKWV